MRLIARPSYLERLELIKRQTREYVLAEFGGHNRRALLVYDEEGALLTTIVVPPEDGVGLGFATDVEIKLRGIGWPPLRVVGCCRR